MENSDWKTKLEQAQLDAMRQEIVGKQDSGWKQVLRKLTDLMRSGRRDLGIQSSTIGESFHPVAGKTNREEPPAVTSMSEQK